ncbi:bifunctional folylpolyglutamate synthase/dihydrofolate synthase [Wenzhouxiangella sp. AB-CW3]|uniref:bifunctional folylpolyglutamate synthase/dihydrofolate synthase n=1 Tax=Wenzhouxiangella sp. AB-CW3 TaxID=2771012 RepID=UPI00168C02B4|nr:Mur ligase family protein [Wenzhouxiangella sp. AB-CW3]QOC23577.1 bifunctional folylpolyglutamate synthase/dihydrofolate synthase [Wenzhouxiangella sp. AB-CW3]
MSDISLATWLDRLEQRTPESRIDLGLERVREVADRLDIARPDCPVVTVAGTNGKGSVVAMLEAMAVAGGLKPFAYTSPHILQFAERMRFDRALAPDDRIAAAIAAVERARRQVALTYFEHITLAALLLASRMKPDVLFLEVGLGGRLDAVNLVDADVAVLTSIGLDHTEWLGRTRAAIAREKAGIARSGRPVIVGEKRRPPALEQSLSRAGADMMLAGRQLKWRRVKSGLRVELGQRVLDLPRPALPGRWQEANAACAVAAMVALEHRLDLNEEALSAGLRTVSLPGRMQRFGSAPEIIVDVAHNAAAARTLASALESDQGRCLAVFAALSGKDVKAIGRVMNDAVDHWLIAGLTGDRGQSAEQIDAGLAAIPVSGGRETVESVPRALERALARARRQDRIVVFGSFRTVAEAWPTLMQQG